MKIAIQVPAFRRRASALVLVVAGMGSAMPGAGGQVDVAPVAHAEHVPVFDVVSVKTNHSGTNMMSMRFGDDGFATSNATLHMLLANAYGFDPDRISGLPKWGDSDRFDVRAKVAEPDIQVLKKMPFKERSGMFVAVMEDRFRVKVHRETKELPVYDLVIAKGGSKLKEAAPGDTYANGIKGPDGVAHAGMMRMGRGELVSQGNGVVSLLGVLANAVHRPVIDKTGLKGVYDISLRWQPEEAGGGSSADEAGPSIFTALEEQLGLRLEPSKGPVETLVVDSAEKPSED